MWLYCLNAPIIEFSRAFDDSHPGISCNIRSGRLAKEKITIQYSTCTEICKEAEVEAPDRSSSQAGGSVCAECEQPTASNLLSLAGASLCAECAEAYYVSCSGCAGLLPKDESLDRRGLAYCAECFAAPAGARAPVESDAESLIAEFVALHAEEKRISKRMSEIKESLKAIAASQQRVGNAVTMRAGEAAVRCSYRVSLKCDTEAVEALEQVLDREEFSRLFERKTSFNAVEGELRDFLASEDAERERERELVRKAVRETEIPTLSVISDRK